MTPNLAQAVLRRLKRAPSTCIALGKHTCAEQTEIEAAIDRLRTNRLIRISGYVRARGTTWPVYDVGGRKDADPRDVKPKANTSKESSPAFMAYCEAKKKKTDDYILSRLAIGPGTFADLAKDGGPSIRTIKDSLRRLRGEGVVYSESESIRKAYTWHLTGVPQKKRPTPALPVPSYALRSVFFGGRNPWTGEPA